MKTYILILLVLMMFGCDSDSASGLSQNTNDIGKAGSLARFTTYDDHLYSVDNSTLNVFSIVDRENPVKVNEVFIGFNIETLFNFKEFLYVGSQNGMYIYSIQNPEEPLYLSEVQHFTACDPVVANATHAFVTLHADIGCGTNINVLEIYDVNDVVNPIFISRRHLTKPIGLGLYGDYLIVCDDEVKIFDISDIENTSLIHSINGDAFDVIVNNDTLILIGENGLYQYSLNPNSIQNTEQLSTINI
ncbi:hypothetical protein ES692_09055 [Psychroserpens burtonensis]|uniref:LVIVD repeat-containing protein n=1 Tax=Psychroserpens burtonensis TaxID=49278 RepID=A0A5C7B844_9FLAO|nr:hypothetical protein [Psychroserpens burtonensis]TXE17415.1 hypothetical protein ES692_09055 [Psychroserpens burtonensis]